MILQEIIKSQDEFNIYTMKKILSLTGFQKLSKDKSKEPEEIWDVAVMYNVI